MLITYIQNIPTETSVKIWDSHHSVDPRFEQTTEIFCCVNWYLLTFQISLLLHIKGNQTRSELRGLLWRWRHPDPQLHQELFTNLHDVTPKRNFNLKIKITTLQYHIWLVTGYNFIISYHQCFILSYILFAKCQTDNANSILPLSEFLQCFHFLQFYAEKYCYVLIILMHRNTEIIFSHITVLHCCLPDVIAIFVFFAVNTFFGRIISFSELFYVFLFKC